MRKRNTIRHDGKTLFQVPGFPAYYIDRAGNVYSMYRKRGHQPQAIEPTIQKKLKPFGDHKTGDLQYCLCRNGKKKKTSGHRVLCELFHGPPPSRHSQALHRNDVRTDNCAANLYWGTALQNRRDAVRNGGQVRGSRHGVAKLTEADVLAMRKQLAEGMTPAMCAKRFRLSLTTVYCIRDRKTWTHI